MKLPNDLLSASDKGLLSALVLLDFTAAFDTIIHYMLLQRLEHLIGIEGTALSQFKSHLPNCFQFIHVDVESSVHSKVSHIIPQGSVLEPIIFTLYIYFP